ncbi:membrane-associated oxidoreductase [Streptomyces sp. NPDC050982]|uniref:membrane-associated oxidoreductase n=1 Tax=Streptomyces sp. NPDC050982 TaxID=3154746 RepID=UPI0033E65B87
MDLSEAAIQGTVRLQRCHFDEAPRLEGSQLEALELTECLLPGLHAHGARIAQEFKVNGCTVNGTLDLRSLSVGTLLSLKDTRIRPAPGEAGVDAQSVAVDEYMWAAGLDCAGPFYLNNARVQDALVFRGATIGGPEGYLQMPEITVGGGLYLGHGFSCAGMVNLCGASIGASVELSDTTLTGPGTGPGAYALHVGCAQIGGDIQADGGLVVHGPVTLADTSVRGSVVLKGARLNCPSGTALTAGRIHIGGDLDCRNGLTANGAINLSDARIGGSVLFDAAELTAPDSTRTVLRANGIDVGGVVNLRDGFIAHGRIRLSSATIRSALSFNDAVLDTAADEEALVCRGTSAAVMLLRLREAPLGIVDLSRTRVVLLQDEPTAWPAFLAVEGTVYDNLRPALPASDRLPWLGRDPQGFTPQPYEQLASVYQRHGREADARTVLVAKQRSMRSTLTLPARMWSLVQDATVGYGYRPLRAVWLLTCLLAIGSMLFTIWPPTPVGEGPYPRFQPVIYALDLLLPLVDLSQERAYGSSGAMQWIAIVLIGTGWLLATTVAAGAGRVLRRT